MWTCPLCDQQFIHANQRHSCNDRTVEDFLEGKSAHTRELFYHFVDEYRQIGDFVLHPTKSTIRLAAHTRFCSIIQLGKDFVDVALHLPQLYPDNLCFHKMGQIPGSNVYNHHCRLYAKEDVTDELKGFMRLALAAGQRTAE